MDLRDEDTGYGKKHFPFSDSGVKVVMPSFLEI
jgi:hypothetical protein